MSIKYLLFIAFFYLACPQIFSQAAIGEWTDYQSYSNALNVADTGEKVYCVTRGGLFSYSKTDHTIQKISGINGLSDVGIERLAYNKTSDILVIAYQNANIDLLKGNDLFNLSDIKRKQLSADKTIHNILFSGKMAYLSCGFGIVVINLEKNEIQDTYFIGKDGSYLQVFDMATDGTSLFAATEKGILRASVAEPNLQDYSKWQQLTNIPHYDQKFSEIEFFNGKILANYTPDEWALDELYQLNTDGWNRVLTEVNYVTDLTSNGKLLVVSSREEVFVFDEFLSKVTSIRKYTFSDSEETSIQPGGAEIDASKVIWIADMKYGLIKIGAQTEKIVPEGPVDNNIFSLTSNGNDLWVSAGGRNNSWNNNFTLPQFQLYRERTWTVFDKNDFPVDNEFRDIVCVTVDPNDPDHFFAGSWGGGVLEFKDRKFVKRHHNLNSSLQTQLPEQPNAPYTRIGGMAFDSKGNLWVTNSGVARVLSVLKADGSWTAYELGGIANNYSIGKVVVTQNNDKWIVVPRGHDLYVMNSANDLSREQRVVAYFTNGQDEVYTEMSEVYALTEDKNGELWVGTSKGVAVFSNPQKVWDNVNMYASRPGLDLGDQTYHPLLEKETVTAIAVDGANRKWIGTKNSGIFLISENGEKEIEHFNNENSPLPNNEITDIAINHQTGEVFIGTISGLISYMGEATSGNEEFTDVYVYPNPVRETYDGPIVVKGLIDNTDVKITDVTGNLVYKTVSLGGQAIWDGKNLNGNRCKTGVYLVLMNDKSGAKTKITKILFIH